MWKEMAILRAPTRTQARPKFSTQKNFGHACPPIWAFFVRLVNQRKHFFFCESDLYTKLPPRPEEYYYRAKYICEKANSTLTTSLEPDFDFNREISKNIGPEISGPRTGPAARATMDLSVPSNSDLKIIYISNLKVKA